MTLLIVAPLWVMSFDSLATYGELSGSILEEDVGPMMLWAFYSVVLSAIAMLLGRDAIKSYGLMQWDWKRDLLWPVVISPIFWLFTVGTDELFYLAAVQVGLAEPERVIEPVSTLNPLLLVVVLLASALAEEISVRSVLTSQIERLWSRPWISVVVSSALFTGYHVYQGYWMLPGIFVSGVIFAMVFLIWRSLAQVTIVHCLLNLWLYLVPLER